MLTARSFSLVAVLCCVPACASSPRPFVHDAAAESSLLATERAFNDATTRRGLEGWVSFFADDGAQFPAGQPMIRGHEAIRKEMAPLFDDKTLSLTWEPAEASVAASGDLGFVTGHALLTKTGPGGEKTITRLKYLTVWKRQPDGTWKVAADIGNAE